MPGLGMRRTFAGMLSAGPSASETEFRTKNANAMTMERGMEKTTKAQRHEERQKTRRRLYASLIWISSYLCALVVPFPHLLRTHPNCTIQPQDGAVEHDVFHDVPCERGEFGGTAETGRERALLFERLL